MLTPNGLLAYWRIYWEHTDEHLIELAESCQWNDGSLASRIIGREPFEGNWGSPGELFPRGYYHAAARATTITLTSAAPACSKASAAALQVAPVVRTSSTKTTRKLLSVYFPFA